MRDCNLLWRRYHGTYKYLHGIDCNVDVFAARGARQDGELGVPGDCFCCQIESKALSCRCVVFVSAASSPNYDQSQPKESFIIEGQTLARPTTPPPVNTFLALRQPPVTAPDDFRCFSRELGWTDWDRR